MWPICKHNLLALFRCRHGGTGPAAAEAGGCNQCCRCCDRHGADASDDADDADDATSAVDAVDDADSAENAADGAAVCCSTTRMTSCSAFLIDDSLSLLENAGFLDAGFIDAADGAIFGLGAISVATVGSVDAEDGAAV